MACDTPENLSRSTGDVTLDITADAASLDPDALKAAVPGVKSFEMKPSDRDAGCFDISVSYPAEEDFRRQLSQAITAGGGLILSMREARLSLEDIFLELTDPGAEAIPEAPEAPQAEEHTEGEEK